MTLLELLVTMTLLAMVSALLIQGFSTALGTYERVQRKQGQRMPLELGYHWFAETLSGAQAELDVSRQLHGTGQEISGVTHRPLIGEAGQASFFSWRLVDDPQGLRLVYTQPGSPAWVVAQWPVGSRGHFVYRSLQGAPSGQWPDADGDQPPPQDGRIPGAILLEVVSADGPPLHWYANLSGRTFPRPDYRDF